MRIAPASLPIVLVLSGTAGAGERLAWREYVGKCLDTLIERGTDRYGPVETALFMSVIDVRTLTAPEKPELLDTEAYYEEGRAHRRAMGGSNFWYDQAAIRVLYRYGELAKDPKYGRAADRCIDAFFERARRPGGLPAWGTHVYYDAYRDRPGGDGDGAGPHEILVYIPEWAELHRRRPGAMREIVDGIWSRHVCDKATGQHNRHDDGAPGCDFAFSGGSLALACASLGALEKDPVGLERARTIAGWHWRHADPRTGLIPDAPALTDRFDGRHSMTTLPGPFAALLLRCGEATGEALWLERASAIIKAYDRYGWDPGGKTYWGMLALDGKPVPEGPRGPGYDAWAPAGPVDVWKTTIYSYEFPLICAQSAVWAFEMTAARGSPDPELLAIALRWAGVIERALPPRPGRRWGKELRAAMPDLERTGGTYAEDYGRTISFFIHLGGATGEPRWKELAESVAREAVDKLWAGSIFRAHPAKPYYEATQGVGILLHALLELALLPERWRPAM